jgi:TRAP-type mannitol/chloroaromatic compound transport system substrate-binding protein
MTNRRNWNVAMAAALAAPLLAKAQTKPAPLPMPVAKDAPSSGSAVTLRIQSAYPEKEMLTGFGQQWAERVNALGGGRLKIEFLNVNSVAKTYELVSAVSQGKLDGGVTYTGYQHDVDPAFSLWSTGPAFGMDARMLMAWQKYGGGQELMAQLYKSKGMDVHSMLFMPFPTQPLGWFKKSVSRVDELKGLKFRTTGLSLEVWQELGAQAKPMPGSEVSAAIQKGDLDGGDFHNMTSDRLLGYNKAAQYCMLQSYSKATSTMEIVINSKAWDSLSAEHKLILETAASAISSESAAQMAEKNSRDYLELSESGTTFMRTPATILQAQLNAWDKVIVKHASQDALFAKIVNSQKEYAKRVTRWQSDVEVDYRNVYNHYFSRRLV